MLHFFSGIVHKSSGVTVTEEIVKVGLRVVRGKDWNIVDQDGNGKGTVIEKDSERWWKVQWDLNGLIYRYRVGYDGKYDLNTA